MIKLCTITGADDSVSPADLILISQRYPFVEWGILVSPRRNGFEGESRSGGPSGNPRWPSYEWMKRLRLLLPSSPIPINLSLHLCGEYVEQFLYGDDHVIGLLGRDMWSMFQRVQLNTHAIPHSLNLAGLELLERWREKEFIFQYDGVNGNNIQIANHKLENISALFDVSHGTGVCPSEWPAHLTNIKCGYAGGLGPDNLSIEIPRIITAALKPPMYEVGKGWSPAKRDIWIDMETRVRSYSLHKNGGRGVDDYFDLAKVRACLAIVEQHRNPTLANVNG